MAVKLKLVVCIMRFLSDDQCLLYAIKMSCYCTNSIQAVQKLGVVILMACSLDKNMTDIFFYYGIWEEH